MTHQELELLLNQGWRVDYYRVTQSVYTNKRQGRPDMFMLPDYHIYVDLYCEGGIKMVDIFPKDESEYDVFMSLIRGEY